MFSRGPNWISRAGKKGKMKSQVRVRVQGKKKKKIFLEEAKNENNNKTLSLFDDGFKVHPSTTCSFHSLEMMLFCWLDFNLFSPPCIKQMLRFMCIRYSRRIRKYLHDCIKHPSRDWFLRVLRICIRFQVCCWF